ncbi:hypothetical protein [Bacillus sp. MUM 116]|uniref:hypothetical protein n=1 Tax=Bacillus sp. MUM 116 TaxID=1678002 RepID=UPI0015A60E08|nr:hypothetical protein [Bacillus sp. MUM 116]
MGISGGSTARKSPIGSTNNQCGWKNSPLIEVSPYIARERGKLNAKRNAPGCDGLTH